LYFRGIAGTRKNTIIINLPGSVKGATEMATIALPGIPHAVALMRGDDKNVKKVHAELHASHHSGHHCHHSHSKSKVIVIK
jgi:molybdopterin biosynthesis enzyme MoaB